ncbi:PorP/SprF family type IX secretion system membrane protein [Mucilaginibacter sp. McL0603]|uniref:PorP/SprF family type IX secretion system membrane protein n=1 Tax=Mucilaginibacter sp. McL0603 TaxID=3415670 RepID=UPI003CECF0ED
MRTTLLGIIIAMLFTKDVHAQLTSMQSAFFQNQYLVNPAMAGLENQLNINMDYHQQWTTLPGSPRLTSVTADYNSGNKVGLGVNIYNDKAGLINRTRLMFTYAYHITLNGEGDILTGETTKLNLGLSAGLNSANIDESAIVGDIGDLALAEFNNHNLYPDGDLGASYTSSGFNAQVALPNLKRTFFKSDKTDVNVEGSTFYTAISYKIQLSNSYSNTILRIEPKIAYRGVEGFSNIFDIGANFYRTSFGNNTKLNITALYHTNNCATLGAGFDIDNFGLLFCYSANTGPLSTYANNTFEVGVSLRFIKKK